MQRLVTNETGENAMTTKKARVSRPVNGLGWPPSSYEEYLLLTEKDKLRLIKQEQAKRPNDRLDGQEGSEE
jgi:hypothetical protein